MGKSVDRKQVDEIKILFDVVSHIYKKNTEKITTKHFLRWVRSEYEPTRLLI